MRVRRRRRLETWQCANGVLHTLNSLGEGRCCRPRTVARRKARGAITSSPPMLSQVRVQQLALREASRLLQARRSCPLGDLTGVHSVAALLKADKVDRYGSKHRAGFSQTELISAEVDEPPATSGVVNMLAALPPEEAAFYEAERQVVDPSGKSEILFNEIEDRYGFFRRNLHRICELLCAPRRQAPLGFRNRREHPSCCRIQLCQEEVRETPNTSHAMQCKLYAVRRARPGIPRDAGRVCAGPPTLSK
jgi:hypothetical protein